MRDAHDDTGEDGQTAHGDGNGVGEEGIVAVLRTVSASRLDVVRLTDQSTITYTQLIKYASTR